MMTNGRDDDPLSRVMAPPPDETEECRKARLLAEAEAKRISDAIDEELQQQARAERRGPRPMKMLLLGESHRDGISAALTDTYCMRHTQVKVNQVRPRSSHAGHVNSSSAVPIRQVDHVEE